MNALLTLDRRVVALCITNTVQTPTMSINEQSSGREEFRDWCKLDNIGPCKQSTEDPVQKELARFGSQSFLSCKNLILNQELYEQQDIHVYFQKTGELGTWGQDFTTVSLAEQVHGDMLSKGEEGGTNLLQEMNAESLVSLNDHVLQGLSDLLANLIQQRAYSWLDFPHKLCVLLFWLLFRSAQFPGQSKQMIILCVLQLLSLPHLLFLFALWRAACLSLMLFNMVRMEARERHIALSKEYLFWLAQLAPKENSVIQHGKNLSKGYFYLNINTQGIITHLLVELSCCTISGLYTL